MKRNLQAGVRRNAALRLEVFTDADLDDIHRATLEVLERTGVRFASPKALAILEEHGELQRRTAILLVAAQLRLLRAAVRPVARAAPVVSGRMDHRHAVVRAERGHRIPGRGVRLVRAALPRLVSDRGHVGGGLIHLLLVIALIVFIVPGGAQLNCPAVTSFMVISTVDRMPVI